MSHRIPFKPLRAIGLRRFLFARLLDASIETLWIAHHTLSSRDDRFFRIAPKVYEFFRTNITSEVNALSWERRNGVRSYIRA